MPSRDKSRVYSYTYIVINSFNYSLLKLFTGLDKAAFKD